MNYSLLAIVTIVATVLVNNFVPLPFIWILFGWFAFFLIISVRSKNTVVKVITVNITAILFILGSAEAFVVFKAHPWEKSATDSNVGGKVVTVAAKSAEQGSAELFPVDKPYVRHIKYLGFGPIPDQTTRKTRDEGGTPIYDVEYGIGLDALRVMPPFNALIADECILFFGGSFTFGEGVNDNQTMPYVVGMKTQGRYRIYNFGFHAYGPHQMLSAIDHGLVDEKIECKPKYVFYTAIRAHVKRSVGGMDRNRQGPRYNFDRDGKLFFNGHFDTDDGDPSAFTKINHTLTYKLLSRSYLFMELHRKSILHSEHLDIMMAIVDSSRKKIENRWPGSEFHVILWNDWIRPKNLQVQWALEKEGFRIHQISDILPNYYSDKAKYILSERDRHPSVLANETIADYLVKKVIK